MLLKTLVYRGGEVNSSGCRGMSVETEDNNCCRFIWGGVGMESTDGAVDEKHIGI